MKSQYDTTKIYEGLSPVEALEKLYQIHKGNPYNRGGGENESN